MWDIPHQLEMTGDDAPLLDTVTSRDEERKPSFWRACAISTTVLTSRATRKSKLKDGRIVDRHSGSLFDAHKSYLGRVWFFRDITEKRRAAENIARLARTNAVTGLANRTCFLDRLKLEFARARAGHQVRRASISISIISRTSTTRSGTRSATSCCSRSPSG